MKVECSICFEKIAEDERQVTVTKCGHLFHSECVGAWVNQSINATCPQCRHVIRVIELRTVFFNTASNRRDSDIFNSSFASNMRTIQEDLCITQSNLEIQIKHLKTENETLKDQVGTAQRSERHWKCEAATLKIEAQMANLEIKKLERELKESICREVAAKENEKKLILAAESVDRMKKATSGKSAALKGIEYVHQ